MRNPSIALILALWACTASGGLAGSTVTLLYPLAPIDALTAEEFGFLVEKDSLSEEYILSIHLTFPNDFRTWDGATGYEEIEAGRPAFSMDVDMFVASWEEVESSTGGVHMGESVLIWATVISSPWPPSGTWFTIEWTLVGSWGSSEGGAVYFLTPVESRSWGRIKTLYR